VLGDVQDGVETQQINQVVRADRNDARGADARVDLLDRQLLLLCSRQTSEMPALRIRLTTNPGTSAQVIGCLRIAWRR